jgi:hypothetical protein
VPAIDSPITVRNQPNIIDRIVAMPSTITNLPAANSLSHRAAPPTVKNRPNEPMIGQRVPFGT